MNVGQGLPLMPPGVGKGSSRGRPAWIASSQETGFDAYINHVPGGERRSFTYVHVCAPCGGLVASFGNPAIQILHSEKNHTSLLMALSVFLPALSANAIVVRGTVTDPLGAVVAGAKVQLVHGQKVAAFAITDPDGTYEIRSADQGRFILLTSAATFTPGISEGFYGARSSVIERNVVLEVGSVMAAVTVTATGIPTPLQQVSSPVVLIPEIDFARRVGIVDEMRQSPGVAVVQTGQYGGVASLFVRGGNSTANMVRIDGITAEDIGGVFDYGNVSSTGVAGLELYRGPNSALYGTDAGASVVSMNTPRGSSLRPVLNYSGDAGNFHTYRNEAALSGAYSKLDYYGAFSRFDSSNALPNDEYHSATAVSESRL